MLKRIFSLILALSCLLSILPNTLVSAETTAPLFQLSSSKKISYNFPDSGLKNEVEELVTRANNLKKEYSLSKAKEIVSDARLLVDDITKLDYDAHLAAFNRYKTKQNYMYQYRYSQISYALRIVLYQTLLNTNGTTRTNTIAEFIDEIYMIGITEINNGNILRDVFLILDDIINDSDVFNLSDDFTQKIQIASDEVHQITDNKESSQLMDSITNKTVPTKRVINSISSTSSLGESSTISKEAFTGIDSKEPKKAEIKLNDSNYGENKNIPTQSGKCKSTYFDSLNKSKSNNEKKEKVTFEETDEKGDVYELTGEYTLMYSIEKESYLYHNIKDIKLADNSVTFEQLKTAFQSLLKNKDVKCFYMDGGDQIAFIVEGKPVYFSATATYKNVDLVSLFDSFENFGMTIQPIKKKVRSATENQE